MIVTDFSALAEHLRQRAAVLAQARAQARRPRAGWWRQPELIWPLFTKG